MDIKAKTYMVVAFLRNNDSLSKELIWLEYDMFFHHDFYLNLQIPLLPTLYTTGFRKKKEQKYFHEITLCTN